MKKLAVLVAALLVAAPAFAGNTGIVKLSLWGNIAEALPNNIHNITGVDVGIGSAADTVTGVQWDFIHNETNTVKGVQTAWIWNNADTVYGVQSAIVSINENKLMGVQGGWINLANGEVIGAQLGLYNQVADLHGLQLGFVNYAKHISKGLQIGLLNIAKNGWLPAMIIVNGRF